MDEPLLMVGIFIMENEIWKEINGFYGKYLISNLGRVKSIGRKIGSGIGYFKEEKILKHCFDKDGYPMVSITGLNRRNHPKRVHILVAIHFISPKPNINSFVCHKDDNVLNVSVSNLYWGDLNSNVLDRYKNGNTKFSIAEINTIRALYKEGKSQKELRLLYPCNSSFMSRLINNKRNKLHE